ncbi:hypothetical protein [Natronogracilivirga saccharolytica]|nr:hypothetical protein [Natronogracilivirga saccharolytica]
MKKRYENAGKNRISSTPAVYGIILLLFVMLTGFSTAQAQESVQIDIVNIPGVLPSPFISDLENDVRAGTYQVQLNYVSTGTTPVDLIFEVRLYKNRDLLVQEFSEPASFDPGMHILSPVFDDLTFERSQEDIISDLDSDLQSTILQTGALPEGDYRIEISAEPADGQTGVNFMDGRATFTVTHPQPPQLVTPANGSNITMETPLFSWTPVLTRTNVSLEYELRIVELFDGQSPEEAIDANRPLVEETLTDITTFTYTPDQYPLERGRSYAWQITAYEVNDEMPIRNDGESEIYYFTYHEEREVDTEIADLEEIELVPDVAYIVNPQDLEFEDIGGQYELNGPADVELRMDYMPEPVTVPARVQGLSIQQASLDNPVISAGQVHLSTGEVADYVIPGLDNVTLEELVFQVGAGFDAVAQFEDPDYGSFFTQGNINLTRRGPDGLLTVEGSDLISFESDDIFVEVNAIQIHLRQGSIYGEGAVSFWGSESPCTITNLNLRSEDISTGWSCDQPRSLPLPGDSDNLQLTLMESNGNLELQRDGTISDADLISHLQLDLGFDGTDPCGIRFAAGIGTDGPGELEVIRQTCTSRGNEVDLGFGRLDVDGMEMETFAYDHGSGQWEFSLVLDADVLFPLFEEWGFTPDDDIRLTDSGIEIPSFSTDQNLPEYDHDGLLVTLQQLALESFTFPWLDWDGDDPGDWNLTFDAEAALSEGSGALPGCLAGAALVIDNGRVSSGLLAADLSLTTLSDCEFTLPADHKVVFSSLDGSIQSEYESGSEDPLTASADFSVSGHYEPGHPVVCPEDPTGTDDMGSLAFQDGIMVGKLSLDQSGCDMPVGPMDATLNQADLILDDDGGEQQARFEAAASLMFSENHQVDGQLAYNIMEGEFDELEFLIEDPFELDIPSENPVFSFGISEASIDLDGLHIDGRHEIIVGDDEIGVTFDDVVQKIEERTISSGSIYLDRNFALMVSFEDGIDAPEFSAMPIDDDDDSMPDVPDESFYMELGADVVIDSSGISTSGDASGALQVADLEYGDLTLSFSDEFAFQLNPFRVGSGRVNLYYNDTRIAYVDGNGLYPLVSGFAEEMLPDKLPIPSTSVAYLKLRDDDGELLVDIEEPEPGLITLQTVPGESVDMVMPALDESDPPVIAGVEFDEFTITATPGNFQVDTGNASVTIDEDDALADLAENIDFPFDLSRISYGRTDELDDDGGYLQLAGDLRLFGHTITEDAGTLLKISSSGMLSADFDMVDVGSDIPMIGDNDWLQIGIESVQGSVAFSLPETSNVNYDIDVDTEFRFGDEAESLFGAVFNLQPGQEPVRTSFDSFEPDEPVRLELPGFTINLNSITSVPESYYSSGDGWDFTMNVDADFEFDLAGAEPFTLPMDGLQIGTQGFSIPPQEINDGTMDGLDLPSFGLAGFEFQPLALRTEDPITFNWFEGELPDAIPYLDFELHLPDFAGGALNPPDGFTFYDVTISDGFLSGSMEPVEPDDGISIPAGPPGLDPPQLLITAISGALDTTEEDGETTQDVDFSLAGTIDDIPFFEDEEAGCEMEVTYDLSLVAGEGLQGEIDGLEPCGSLTAGPVTLSGTSGSLVFSYEDDEQQVIFDGGLSAELEGPENVVTADGTVELDLLSGQILDGSIDIDQPFLMSLPGSEPSFMDFEVNQAELSQEGFVIDASGYLEAGDVQIDVVFDELAFGFPEFAIQSGQAEISSGFGLKVGVGQTSSFVSVIDYEDAATPENDALVFSADGTATLDADGLGFTGEGGASLVFDGEEYLTLHAAFEDGFTYSTDTPAVNDGQARFYTDSDREDLLAVYDTGGFNFGEMLIAMLPDTLGLPSKDIAYAVITDDDGDPVISVESNDDGGYTLETGDEPLSVHFPALEDAVEGEPYVDAYFTLSTDDQYMPNGGDITLASPMSLEPYIDAPVSLDSIALDTDGQVRLTSVITVDLPEAFGDHVASAETTIGSGGFEEAVITFGEFAGSWDESLEPVVQREIGSTLSGETEESQFMVGLYGAELSFNSPAQLEMSGVVETTLLETEDETPFPFFYSGGYGEDGWYFDVDAIGELPEADMGLAQLVFDEHDPFDISADQDEFVVEINGQVSFEDMIGESLSFSVKEMQIGVDNLQASPGLVFDIGEATLGLDEQEFEFFEGALAGSFTDPSLTISGRTLSASISSGELEFLDEEMTFEDLYVDTQGDFTIGDVAVEEIELLGEYLILESVGLSRTQEEGLRLSGQFGFIIPDPVDQYGNMIFAIGRDSDKQVFTDVEIPDDSPFDPHLDDDEEVSVDITSDITLTMTDVLFDVDIHDIANTHMAVIGNVSFMGEERIWLGEEGSIEENPGISLKGNRSQMLVYNITGNAGFTFDHTIFEVSIEADVASSNDEIFEVTLNGDAGVDVPGFSGSASFENIVINSGGFENRGNFYSGASFTVMKFATLELGVFEYESDDSGIMIDVPSPFGDDPDPEDMENAEEEVDEIEVVQLLHFHSGNGDDDNGSALKLSLGGEANTDDGGFGGGIDELVFYETTDGEISFAIRNMNLALDEAFQASASLLYEQTGGETNFFVAANLDIGGGLEALIAGGIQNRDDDLSFGFFVGVRSDVAFDLVPGVVAMSGFGGGFFYRPVEDHVNIVMDHVDQFRPDPPGDLERASSGRPTENADFDDDVEIKFVVMLLAELDMFGVGDRHVVSGSTFIEITNLSFAIDADGHVLGLDGSPMMVGATFFASVDRIDDFTIHVDLEVEMDMVRVIEAEGSISFMLVDGEEGVQWGLLGEYSIDLFGGLMGSPGNRLLASNDGFMIEAGVHAGFDAGIVSAEASVTGSVWYLRYDEAEMPFGAYATVSGEASILWGLISGDATLKAVVSRVRDHYEFYGYGVISYRVIKSRESDAWVSVSTEDGIDVDGGRNPDPDQNLFTQAQDQADEFEQMVTDAIDGVQSELDRPAVPGVDFDEETLAQAGYHYIKEGNVGRFFWNLAKVANEQRAADINNQDIPDILTQSIHFHDPDNHILIREPTGSEVTGPIQNAEDALQLKLDDLEDISEQTVNELEQIVVSAVEFESEAAEMRSDAISALAQDPAQITNDPGESMSEGNTPDFEVNEDDAASQAESANNLSEEIAQLEEQIHAAVDSIRHNLEQMNNLLEIDVAAEGIGAESDESATVNQVSEYFAETLTAVDKYYATLADEQWQTVNYSRWIAFEFGRRQGAFELAIEDELLPTIINAHNARNTNQEDFEDARETMAERVRMIESLADDPRDPGTPYDFSGYDAQTQVYDKLGEDNVNFDSLEVNIMDLWYNIYVLGYERVVEEHVEFVNGEFTDDYESFRQSVVDIMEVNTEMIDDFYNLRANMLGNLYHIVDNYVEMFDEAEAEGGEAEVEVGRLDEYDQLRADILEELEPPELTDISVDNSHEQGTFIGGAVISWEATHPSGIAEVSLDLQDNDYGQEATAAERSYLTIGNPDDFRYHSYVRADDADDVVLWSEDGISSPDSEAHTRSVDVGIRVRGAGGITARRSATFDMKVGAYGDDTSPSDNILPSPDQTSPPEDMMVDLAYYYGKGEYESSMIQPDGLGGFEYASTSEEAYFTSDPEVISMRVLVNEPEMSIANYDYQVGHLSGEDDVLEQTDLVGDQQTYPDVPGNWTEMVEAETRIINMELGEMYFLSVGAWNLNDQGIGVTKERPVIYDDTPPTDPGPSGDLVLTFTQSFFQPSVDENPVIDNPPDYSLDFIQQLGEITNTDAVPELPSVAWSESEDDLSGIKHYEYLVTESDSYSDAKFSEKGFTTEDNEVSIVSGQGAHESLDFDFTDKLHVHVRAVNNAGLTSEVYTIGPSYPHDPNPPSQPSVNGYKASNEIRAYITKRSYDAESGMKGHQFAVGSSPGGTDIRGWPDDDDMDFDVVHAVPGHLSDEAPYVSFDKDELPEGEDIYITVRGVNNQGTRSKMIATGPFIIDSNPPDEPEMELSIASDGSLDVSLSDVQDPVSGVESVELFINEISDGTSSVIEGWHTIYSPSTPQTWNLTFNRNYSIPDEHEISDVRVYARVTNAAGLQTIVWEDVPTLELNVQFQGYQQYQPTQFNF